jgi:hypothetical protein
MDVKAELYAATVCAMLQPKFYVPSVKEQIDHLSRLVKAAPPGFVAKLMIYAREKMHLRSVPLVLAVEAAGHGKADARAIARVIQRADEITEILAYYASANERKETKRLGRLSSAIKRAVAAAFNKFDEYQFAKYDRDGEVRLRDALFLTHPKPKDDAQAALFKRIAERTLETPYTWETELSAKGGTAEVWTELVESGKLGYMALLRNVRNMLDAGVGEATLAKVASVLADPERVAQSRQLPFRFYSAWRALKEKHGANFAANPIRKALQAAAVAAIANFPFDDNERIVVATDISGSMQNRLSDKSEVEYWEVGAILAGSAMTKAGNNIGLAFNTSVKRMDLVSPHPFSVAEDLRRHVGGGTDGWKVPASLEHEKCVADWVFVFTDMQMWGEESFASRWHSYKHNVAPEAKLVIFDMAGYGKTPISLREKDVYLVAGWSEEIFNALAALRRGSSAVAEIEAINV